MLRPVEHGMDGAEPRSQRGMPKRRNRPTISIRHVAIVRNSSVRAARRLRRADRMADSAGPTTTQHFSAVCYYFARELQKTINVPMGLINSSWGSP